MSQLSCVGRDGIIRTFNCEADPNLAGDQWTYRVTTIPPLPNGDFFELCVAELDPSRVRVVMANHYNKTEYVGMGIPDALLPAIKADLGRNVESSPSRGAAGNIYRTPAATSYWKRLLNAGHAVYDQATDIYTLA
jgi:hypothetical protein